MNTTIKGQWSAFWIEIVVTNKDNGIREEIWKYARKDVEDILGVGWKIEDDDESGIDPLAWIWPEPNVVYPQTRVLVKRKDGNTSLETRRFIRRIANGSSNGDRMIYQKAEGMEKAYRAGLRKEREEEDEPQEDTGGDTEEDEDTDESPVRRGTPARSVRSAARSRRSGKREIRFVEERRKTLETLKSRCSENVWSN